MSEIPTYVVYCYGTLEDKEIVNVMGFMEDYRLAKLQLRDAGELISDPEDSEFFATPCKPLEM